MKGQSTEEEAIFSLESELTNSDALGYTTGAQTCGKHMLNVWPIAIRFCMHAYESHTLKGVSFHT